MLTAALIVILAVSSAVGGPPPCEVPAQTRAGLLCGLRRGKYVSFLGVPYAKQPTGERRFKELEPLDRWKGYFNATSEGAICPQHDVLYGALMTSRNMSESCIHANVHVPYRALPQPGHEAFNEVGRNSTALPILVFVHGGGFAFGSGHEDVHGPEYLMKKRVIVITFNYRVGPFGFLSLNSSSIPGNAGLRDMITLLRWVRENARGFGGDPEQVTVAGQSAGAVAVHLLTLSKASRGLFNKAIAMSGSAVRSFLTTSPIYAAITAKNFLEQLNITETNPELIHQILIQTPLERIMQANRVLQDQTGLALFYPVVEAAHLGVTRIIDDEPEQLMNRGRGSNIPMIIGFTVAECETFAPLFRMIDIAQRVVKNPLLMIPPSLVFTTPPEKLPGMVQVMMERYFSGAPTVEGFTKFCSEAHFIYPAIYAARRRSAVGGAPVYLYQFSYTGQHRVLEDIFGKLSGAAHIEDLTYFFRTSLSVSGNSQQDDSMRKAITTFFTNFMKNGHPSRGDSWPPMRRDHVEYLDINKHWFSKMRRPSEEQEQMIRFYDSLYRGQL